MKKRILICLTVFLLAVSLTFSCAAYTFGRGAESDAQPNYAGIAAIYNRIYDDYSVDAFCISAPDVQTEDEAKAEKQAVDALSDCPDRIVMVLTQDSAYLFLDGACEEMIDDTARGAIYNACLTNGSDTMSSVVSFFAQVNVEVARYRMGGSLPEASLVVVEDASDTPTEQTDLPQEITLTSAPETAGKSVVKPLLICAVIGIVIALIVVLAVKSSYKPVHRKRDAAQYLVDGSLNVTASQDTFSHKETSERKLENKSAQSD